MEILLVGIMVCQTYCYCFPFLGAQPTECSIKLPLSVCPSASLAFFSGIAHYFFFFWYWNICSKIFVSSFSEIFMKNFRTDIFLNIEKEFLCFVYFWQNLKRLSFQLKVYPLFHWSWYAIFITKAITEWTMFYMKTFSFVSSVLIK